MRKKYLLFAGLLLCLFGFGIGYYLYNKPRDNAAGEQAAYHVKAKDLYLGFMKEEQAATAMYVNKVIAINGTVLSVQHEGKDASILLSAGEDATGGVNCTLVAGEESSLPSPGEDVEIKGRCNGFLMDVSVVDAVVVRH